jgi:fermentation-respiration switch protein FrsA (DUF1100 family)
VLKIVDRGRRILLPGGRTEPRPLKTYVRYPALGASSASDRVDAPAARSAGPYPLVIFGHGFNVTPDPYAPLLRAWARAGYVVAAPEFPLESSRAPGGANENDLINQPRDMTVLITRLLRSPRFGPLIDRREVAVSGQSDGGETALTVAYNPPFHDSRVRAAVILSGAKIPHVGGYQMSPGSPPLLATQGTSDTINPPHFTSDFFDIAARPKYLLRLLGAGHLAPYTTEQPQLGIVERVTIAFMDRYLKRRSGAARALVAAGNVSGVAQLVAEP